ncbi:MAG: hypothetical protein U9N53_07685 [Bacteroidota bacterium]|nr:hypothetical protein [Bacteroidota bacterium]
MKKKSIFNGLLFFVFLALGIQTIAQQTVELSEEQFHQKGYYVRIGAAPTFGYSDFEDSFEYSEYGFFFNLRGGYRFSSKIGAHAIFSWMLAEGKTDNTAYDVDKFNMIGVGGGFTFYFGKGYSYIIPEIMANEISTTINDVDWTSTLGLGINLYAGHDINLGKGLGLGIMGFVHYSTVDLELSGNDLLGVTNFYYGAEISLRFGK